VGFPQSLPANSRRNGFNSETFLYSTASRPPLWPTQPSIEWVSGALSQGVKQQLISIEYLGQEYVELYLHSPTRLHGMVLNLLLTKTILPVPLPF
jgi:hypothetical protein